MKQINYGLEVVRIVAILGRVTILAKFEITLYPK